MSNIDKQAQKELYAKVEQQAHSLRGSPREYQALTGLCPVNVIEMHAQKIQALLDELEAKDKKIDDLKATAAHSNAGWKEAHEQEARAEAAEKRIAELEAPAPELKMAHLINKFYERYPLAEFKSDTERSAALGYFMAGAELQCFGEFINYAELMGDE